MDRKAILCGLSSEEGQVWSWLLTIFFTAVVIGAIITQCGPIIANHVSINGLADEAADLAAKTYQGRKADIRTVTAEVDKWLRDHDARLDGDITLRKDESGKTNTVLVPVRRIRNTALFENISYLAPYAEATALGEGSIY